MPELDTTLDPSTVRLSESFLLSDFMGCHSVYEKVLSNPFPTPVLFPEKYADMVSEGERLSRLLDYLQGALGPCSVTYGYLSTELGRILARPTNTPHYWTDGAAADVVFHTQYRTGASPIDIAADIDSLTTFERLITYSESEAICIATNSVHSNSPPREKLYENRYMGGSGKASVTHVKHAKCADRQQRLRSINHSIPWRGRGWPSYHGRGKLQYQHIRLNEYVLLSDLLYDNDIIMRPGRLTGAERQGPKLRQNPTWIVDNAADTIPRPPRMTECMDEPPEVVQRFLSAGEILSWVIRNTKSRVSVIKGVDHRLKRDYIEISPGDAEARRQPWPLIDWLNEKFGIDVEAVPTSYDDYRLRICLVQRTPKTHISINTPRRLRLRP